MRAWLAWCNTFKTIQMTTAQQHASMLELAWCACGALNFQQPLWLRFCFVVQKGRNKNETLVVWVTVAEPSLV
jgi:hypothetical protein